MLFMKNPVKQSFRPWYVVLFCTALTSSCVWAENTDAVETAVAAVALPTTQDEANALRSRAEAIRAAAEARYAEDQKSCRKKILVNDCLEASRKDYIEQSVKARALEKEVRDFEREVHRRDVQAREEKRAQEAPVREAAQQAQAEAFRSEEVRKAEERQRKLADKERKAAEGRKKAEAKEAARREKLEKRARKDAERAAKREGNKPTTPGTQGKVAQ